jgi:translation initiation factor IF-1
MSGDKFMADGVVSRCDRAGFFWVRLDDGHELLCRPAGKMNRPGSPMIRVGLDDRVTVELDAYDLTRGRIVWRDRS